MAMRTRYGHLEEMRQTELDDRHYVMSHISDMLDQSRPFFTTLRSFVACMVLIAPTGTSHASGMFSNSVHNVRHCTPNRKS
ncbi:MAG: hypothetical protein J6P54_04620 [Bacteroidales bacterium]|nr:hypothetical protein [Bacteroidales bacterium]